MTDTTPALSITAEPQVIPTNCLFRVDRTLGSETLYTSDPEWAAEWAPLAAAIFSAVEGIQGVRIGPAEVLVTLQTTPTDWRETARELGSAIRAHLQDDGGVVKKGANATLEGPDLARQKAQQVECALVIDTAITWIQVPALCLLCPPTVLQEAP